MNIDDDKRQRGKDQSGKKKATGKRERTEHATLFERPFEISDGGFSEQVDLDDLSVSKQLR